MLKLRHIENFSNYKKANLSICSSSSTTTTSSTSSTSTSSRTSTSTSTSTSSVSIVALLRGSPKTSVLVKFQLF